MVQCKICELDIHEDKLIVHSHKCAEVVGMKADLTAIGVKMSEYADEADTMTSKLQNSAAVQKKLHKRRLSRPPLAIDPSILHTQTCSTKESQPDARNDSTETENNFSEEDTPSPVKTASRFNFSEASADLNKKFNLAEATAEVNKRLSGDEYQRFIEEYKKSAFALKKVSAFAHRIAECALEIGQHDDPSHISVNELEIFHEQIADTNVLSFIDTFKDDLETYVKKKADYIAECKKLDQISYDRTHEEIKEKFKGHKSSSFKKSTSSFRFNPLQSRFSRDSDASSVENSMSPQGCSRRLIPTRTLEFAASPFQSKRTLPIKQGAANGSTPSPFLAALSNKQSPAQKLVKVDTSKAFLQTNFNHVGSNTSFTNFRKNTEEAVGPMTRSKLKMTFSHLAASEMSESCASPCLSSSTLTPMMSPNLKSISSKEPDVKRRSMFSGTHVNNNFMPNQPSSPMARIEKTDEARKSNHAESPKSSAKNSKKRSNSLGVLKDLRNEEVSSKPQFPSLLQSGISTMASNSSGRNTIGSNEPTFERSGRFEKNPRKKSDDGLNGSMSPSMRSCSSDPNHKWKRKLPIMESSQVTIEDFKFIKFLGRGAYGTVWLVQKKATGDKFAMKIVDFTNRFTQNRMSALKAEKDIYEVLKGDFVVKAIWTFHCGNYICFVTEYMVGGDFNKILESFGVLENDQARFYFGELVLALESLHSLGIIHRDLKPENILLDAQGHIRLTDFGLSQKGLNILRGNNTPNLKKGSLGSTGSIGSPTQAIDNTSPKDLGELKFFNKIIKVPIKQQEDKVEFKVKAHEGENIFGFLGKGQQYTLLDSKRNNRKNISRDTLIAHDKKVRIIGTPDYMAPEVVDPDRFNIKIHKEECIDWWSMGVILYELLVGVPPFNDDTKEKIFDNILHIKLEWPPIGNEEGCITPEAYDLINRLLNPDPVKRLGFTGVQAIKNHSFFKNFNWEDLRESDAPIIPFASDEAADKADGLKIKDEETLKHPFSEPESRKKLTMKSKPLELLRSFQMNRTDVLHKLNEETVNQIQKQKSLKSGTLKAILDGIKDKDKEKDT